MLITNRLNLPRPFVAMMEQEEQMGPEQIRVTSLLKGVCEAALERRYHDQLVRDASEMVWLLFGTAVHSVLEQSEEESHQLKEVRMQVPMAGRVLTGKFDLYDEQREMITDYKTASVWKIIHEDYEDWRRQTLIYAWMLRQQGFVAKGAEIIALLKDHSKSKARFDKGYPQTPVVKVQFHFKEKDFEQIEAWLAERIEKQNAADATPDEALAPCTPEERYNSGDKWAVMKKGRKTAVKVCTTEEQARQMVADGKGDSVEHRPGEDKKCADYCNVNAWCPYYQARMKEENNG